MTGLRGVAVVLCTAAAVYAQAGAATAASTDRGRWLMNEPGTPATATDSSGYGNVGTNYDVVGTGTGYEFDGSSSRVVVADSDSLDPGPADFSFGARLVMDAPPARGETYDILRKGLAGKKGGDYKLEIKYVKGTARARCVVRDTARINVAKVAPTNLADGRPHTVVCSKTSRGVTVRIDSLAPRTKTVSVLGSVSNDYDIGIGAKAEATAKTGFDWFRGTIDEAWVSIG